MMPLLTKRFLNGDAVNLCLADTFQLLVLPVLSSKFDHPFQVDHQTRQQLAHLPRAE